MTTGTQALIAELRHRAGKAGGDAVLAAAADELKRLTSVAGAEMKLREGTFATIEALQAEVALLKRSRLMDDNEAVSALTDVLHAAELIAALRAELAAIKSHAEDATEYVLAQIDRDLRTEVERLRPDAERYRWLREHARRIDFAGLSITSMVQLDARIDAAQEGGK